MKTLNAKPIDTRSGTDTLTGYLKSTFLAHQRSCHRNFRIFCFVALLYSSDVACLRMTLEGVLLDELRCLKIVSESRSRGHLLLSHIVRQEAK